MFLRDNTFPWSREAGIFSHRKTEDSTCYYSSFIDVEKDDVGS